MALTGCGVEHVSDLRCKPFVEVSFEVLRKLHSGETTKWERGVEIVSKSESF